MHDRPKLWVQMKHLTAQMDGFAMTEITNIHVGAIWAPTRGKGHPKVITYIGKSGTVYAVRYPRRAGVMASGFNPKAWQTWVDAFAARWTGDADHEQTKLVFWKGATTA